MNQRHPPRARVLPVQPFLYAIIDAAMTGDRSLTDWVTQLTGPSGAEVVQWRFKGLADGEALAGARELRAATHAAGVLFFVNDRPDIARIVDADGVHVGQDDLDPAEVRALLPGILLGVSTHNPRELQSALDQPVDYIAVGPVFGTTSKANPDPAVGLGFVSWAKERTTKPLVAIGGLNAGNAAAVVAAGADGLAVISPLMKAERPDEAANALFSAIRGSRAR